MIRSIALLTVVLTSTLNSCSSINFSKATNNSISAVEITNLINEGKDIYLENKTITGHIDITKSTNAYDESKNIRRINVTSSLTFIHCIFTGKITGFDEVDNMKTALVTYLKNVSFIECEFKDEVILRGSNFYSNVNFSNSSFIKKASVEGSNIYADAIFFKSSFSDEARFQNIVFHNKVNFMESISGKTISFQGASFLGDAQFSVSKFLSYADFSNTSFQSGCFFNYVEFGSQAIFSNSVFKGRAEFLKTVFSGNTEFKGCIFYGFMKLNEASINSSFNLQNATFIFSKPDLENYKTTDQTKFILDNTKISSFQPFNEKDF